MKLHLLKKIDSENVFKFSTHSSKYLFRWCGQMSRALVSRFGRSGNLNLTGSNPDRAKPLTLRLILGCFLASVWYY